MKVINLDKEIFEKACELCNKEYSYEETLNILKEGSDVEKQIAILKLQKIETLHDANLLVSHLTGQNGPIREVCAIKLNELISKKTFVILDNEQFYQTYTNAVCDVNPNICRCIIEILPKLNLNNYLIDLLIKKLENIFKRIETPDSNQKNFLTVRLFNLYWVLEAISETLTNQTNFEQNEKLVTLLKKATEFNNYTIDEKVAKIIVSHNFENQNIDDLIKKLKDTQNFYVRRYFKG